MQSPDQVYEDAVRRLQQAEEDRSAAKQRILEGLTQRIRDSFERLLKEDLDLTNDRWFNREDYGIYDDYYGVPKEIFEQLVKQVISEYPGKRYHYVYHGIHRKRASIRIEPNDLNEQMAEMNLVVVENVYSPDHVYEVIEQKRAARERHIKETQEAEEIPWIQEQMGYAREAFEHGLKYFQMDGPSSRDILTDTPYHFTNSFQVRYPSEEVAILQRVLDEKNQQGMTHEYYILTKDNHTPLIGIREKSQTLTQ